MQLHRIRLAGEILSVRSATLTDDLAKLRLIVRRRGTGTWHRAKFLRHSPPTDAYLLRDDGKHRTYHIHNIRIEETS